MRLNKYISSTGLCSRREADRYIEEGKVTINGVTATFTSEVKEHDVVFVDGKKISHADKEVYIILHKPRGITCTTEQHIEGNIIDYINYPQRIFPVGRLDKDSTGLILLTSNGDIVNVLLRSEHGHGKEYIVRVDKPIGNDILAKMGSGVQIYNPVTNSYVVTKQCDIQAIDARTFRLVLTQGYNRQIRRMCTAFDYHVQSLKRVRFLTLTLDNLKEGQWRELTSEEVMRLRSSAGI